MIVFKDSDRSIEINSQEYENSNKFTIEKHFDSIMYFDKIMKFKEHFTGDNTNKYYSYEDSKEGILRTEMKRCTYSEISHIIDANKIPVEVVIKKKDKEKHIKDFKYNDYAYLFLNTYKKVYEYEMMLQSYAESLELDIYGEYMYNKDLSSIMDDKNARTCHLYRKIIGYIKKSLFSCKMYNKEIFEKTNLFLNYLDKHILFYEDYNELMEYNLIEDIPKISEEEKQELKKLEAFFEEYSEINDYCM